jgi:nitroimidazol reductase NimA-like FMN-containing flavoprotein (pyridoxamine 5'-phosphate oxidase superfamily)
MSDRNIDNLLDASGYGILSLARDGEAYVIPVSVGYDGKDIYLAFPEMNPPHRKSEFAEATESACPNVPDIHG